MTVALMKSASLSHLIAAVLLAVDPTPPVYTAYGWFISHLFPQRSPELLLRLSNAGLIAATLWILYLLIRRYFGQLTALTTIAGFIFLEMWPLQFLTLEMRTYAAFVFFTTLAIYVTLRALAHPNNLTLICTMLAYCLLVSSHNFGVIYVVCIAGCATLAAAAEGGLGLASKSALSAAPALVMFSFWLPVLRSQAQLGSWILSPDLSDLNLAIYPPANELWVLVLLMTAAGLWGGYRIRRRSILFQDWLWPNRLQIFALTLPISFYASTLAVWLFSRLVFPVFVQRYFFPNIILNVIWLSVVLHLLFGSSIPSTAKYFMLIGVGILTALCINQWQSWGEPKIPCYDPYGKVYIEDPYKNGGLIVALWPQALITRLNRLGETVVFPLDESAVKKDGIEYPPYIYSNRWVQQFAQWAGANVVMTTSQLLNTKPGFMVLDDDQGPWLRHVQKSHHLKLTRLAEMKGCTLWQVRARD